MDYAIARRRMVDRQIAGRGVRDLLVLDAMRKVPRHLFVEEALKEQAYSDYPLPIGSRQTISQPYIVGVMTEALRLEGGERVLEIGTGSGYQAAVLAQIAGRVYTVERIPELARRARRIFDELGISNLNLKVCDGTLGWPEHAPFDAILVTAGSPPSIPQDYLDQLAPGGRLVIPVGGQGSQVLKRVIRHPQKGYSEEDLLDCRFVPLVGRHGWQEDSDRT